MPIIEEVSDEEIVDQEYDETAFDEHNPFDRSIQVEGVNLRPVARQAEPAATASSRQRIYDDPPVQIPELVNVHGHNQPATFGNEAPEHTKSWPIIYPIYLDKKRSLKEGRRVPGSVAVENPLVFAISAACRSFGIDAAVELTKTHPQDWANPGRVRVNYEGPKGALYKRICSFLKTYPITEESAGKSVYQKIAQFDNMRPLAVPKGMKMNKTLPGVSPAVSAQKAIKEAMSGGMPGMPGGAGGDNPLGQMAKMFGM